MPPTLPETLGKYKRQSMELAFGYAKMIDHSTDLAGEMGKARPQVCAYIGVWVCAYIRI